MSLGPFELLAVLFVGIVPVVLFWRILDRAGFPGVLGLVALVPGIGPLVLLAILAFADWPRQR